MNTLLNRNYVLFLLVSFGLIALLIGCQSEGQVETSNESANNEIEKTGIEPIVTLKMENGGEIEIELYPDIAPATVDNFISLIEEDFYNGLIFHRVIPGFMIQGGDPDGIGTGGPGYGIKGEFNSNGFENDLSHERGIVSMARSNDPNSAGSQFFIVVDDSFHLDGDYAAFGKVTQGMDVVDDIVGVEIGQNDMPVADQVIDSITIDLKGYERGEIDKQ